MIVTGLLVVAAAGVAVAILAGEDDAGQDDGAAGSARVDRIDLGRRTIPGDVAADRRSAYVVERQSGNLIRMARVPGRSTAGSGSARTPRT